MDSGSVTIFESVTACALFVFRFGDLERNVLVLIAAMVTFANIFLGAAGNPLAFWLLGR